jgi:hypothetical protein
VVGYILGARAGRDTYQRIVDSTRTLANQLAAQRPRATAYDAVTTVAKAAAVKADDVTHADVEAVAGMPKSSRTASATTIRRPWTRPHRGGRVQRRPESCSL